MFSPAEMAVQRFMDQGLSFDDAVNMVMLGMSENKPVTIASLLSPTVPDPATVTFMIINHAVEVKLSLEQKCAEAVKQLYCKCLARIKTTTAADMTRQFPELQLNDQQLEPCPLRAAFCGTVPKFIKTLSESETVRVEQFPELGFCHANIINYSIIIANNRKFMMMEHMVATLDQFSGFKNIADCDKFCHHMISGLSYLHGKGFAHFDVKPTNIGISSAGDFKLIDLGSIAPLGSYSAATTDAYVPVDMEGRGTGVYEVTPTHDFSMLACTMLHKCGISDPFDSTWHHTKEAVMGLIKNSEFIAGEHVAALVALLKPANSARAAPADLGANVSQVSALKLPPI